MVMDDLKYNTQGLFTSEHQIFHANSRTNSYDREEETTSAVEKPLKRVFQIMSKYDTEEDTQSLAYKQTVDQTGHF